MTKFNHCLLVGAIGLAVSGTAIATGTISLLDPDDGQFAWNVTGGTAPNPTADARTVEYAVTAPDILIGRTGATGQITVEVVITGAVLRTAPTNTNIGVQIPGISSVNSISATPGASSFQFTLTPGPAPGIQPGLLFQLEPIALQSASHLAMLGGSVSVAMTIRDTTTGAVLSSAPVTPVLTSVEATRVVNNPGATRTINVLPPSLKRQFTPGSPTVANLGSVNVGLQTTPFARINGTGATSNHSVGGINFWYDVNADKVDLTLSVPNASAFQGAGNGFFAQTTICADPAPGAALPFTVDPADPTRYTVSAPITMWPGVTYNICAVASGTAEIAAQTIGLTSQVNLAGPLTRDPAPVVTPAFSVLAYNGPVVKVQSFNPASNASVDSLLRVLNTSTVSGLVTIESVCQNGQVRGPVSFTLAGTHQVQYSSAELESGTVGTGKPTLSGGLGACTAGGRSQLTISGQVPSMEVQNFLRSTTTGGVVTSGNNNDD
jgi:hypothetical protein